MFQRTAMRLFGALLKPYINYFDGLSTELKRGMIKASAEEYLSLLLFASLIVFVVSLLAGSIFISLSLAAAASALYSYTLAIIVSLLLSGAVFAAGYYYPSMRANSLKTQIERLRSDIRKRDEAVKELSEELNRLKQIDMQRRPSRN